MASSRGGPTVWASTVGLAPGYTARAVIVGGVTSGYSLIASARIDRRPAARMISDRTTAKIGRSMKKRENRTGRSPTSESRLPHRPHDRGDVGYHGGSLGNDFHSGTHPHQTIDDH